jgi:predicted dehydrogenase/NADPH:quinone reductase-like Zn-dependent oxidoreductase
MKQVVQNVRNGQLELLDVPSPQAGRGELLVATRASLISAGTERMLMDFAQKSLAGKAAERPDLVKQVINRVARDGLISTAQAVFSRLEEPLPLGYSAAGEVVAVGEGLETTYKVGDYVAMAGAGIANHAELNVVPKNLVVPMPGSLPFEQACYATVAAIAMQGFRNSEAELGDHVLVLGLGLVGQLTVQLAAAAGCQVFGMDYDPHRTGLALECGAHEVHLLGSGNPDAKVKTFTNGKGFDRIIICAATDSNEPLESAAKWARDRARVVMTGKAGTEVNYAAFMKKELSFVISRSYGPGRYDANYEKKGQDYPVGWVRWTERENLAEAIRLMSMGRMDVTKLTTHTYDIDNAADAYALIGDKEQRSLGVVLTYKRPVGERKTSRVMLRSVEPKQGTVGISCIGAGAYARAVLLPALKQVSGAAFVGVVSKGGLSARKTGEKFKFEYAADSVDSILQDTRTDAVVITTRHDTHADLTIRALKAGKHVFVEKPLALNTEQLEQIYDTLKTSGRVLMVGFNRRFSPYTQAIMENFKDVAARQVTIRVNAGSLAGDNWQLDKAEGGGRLLGEGCHFVDLACYLAGGKPTRISAMAGDGQDNYAITLQFDSGSVANILYTSDGDTSFSKEYIEVFGGGMIGVIDNFMGGFIVQNGKTFKVRAGKGINKGQSAEMEAFIATIQGQEPTILTPESIYDSTLATLLAQQAIEENRVIDI